MYKKLFFSGLLFAVSANSGYSESVIGLGAPSEGRNYLYNRCLCSHQDGYGTVECHQHSVANGECNIITDNPAYIQSVGATGVCDAGSNSTYYTLRLEISEGNSGTSYVYDQSCHFKCHTEGEVVNIDTNSSSGIPTLGCYGSLASLIITNTPKCIKYPKEGGTSNVDALECQNAFQNPTSTWKFVKR